MTPKEVLTNPVFCPMPWTGLMYNFDGSVKNCIRSAETIGDIKDTSINDIIHGKVNSTRQHEILNKIGPTNCKPCNDLEVGQKKFDIISDRKFYIRELKQIPLQTYRPDSFDLQTIDVRWSNLCNFACVYCAPEFSSKWASELNEYHATPNEQQLNEFKEYIFLHAPRLKHVYLAGGEPLLMKENLELLKLLDADVNLRINTNLSLLDTEVFDRICEFKNVHWIVSLETIEDEYDYVRYGGNWQDFNKNLIKIKNLGHKITFNMLHFILNYESIFGCIKYLQQQGFHNNSFVIGSVVNPVYFDIRNLPAHLLDKVQQRLINEIANSPGYLLENGYKNMLLHIQKPFNKNLPLSFKKMFEMDQRRNLNSREIFPELYKLHE
jgi:hypothetical protein